MAEDTLQWDDTINKAFLYSDKVDSFETWSHAAVTAITTWQRSATMCIDEIMKKLDRIEQRLEKPTPLTPYPLDVIELSSESVSEHHGSGPSKAQRPTTTIRTPQLESTLSEDKTSKSLMHRVRHAFFYKMLRNSFISEARLHEKEEGLQTVAEMTSLFTSGDSGARMVMRSLKQHDVDPEKRVAVHHLLSRERKEWSDCLNDGLQKGLKHLNLDQICSVSQAKLILSEKIEGIWKGLRRKFGITGSLKKGKRQKGSDDADDDSDGDFDENTVAPDDDDQDDNAIHGDTNDNIADDIDDDSDGDNDSNGTVPGIPRARGHHDGSRVSQQAATNPSVNENVSARAAVSCPTTPKVGTPYNSRQTTHERVVGCRLDGCC
eukprot:TRINITY_DN12132_c0_g1_i4.p1 TRINITY_DN12132_c0_g1~~TRINITY_DN12132_c0_g1_i4.p1  ORF type:complete len:437 (+),score=67.75 TRINITY_DN12132_c0_g1_i4:183-1313(+)